MSKVYEALEHAQRESKKDLPQKDSQGFEEPSRLPELVKIPRKGGKPGIENAMVALYHSIESLLPDTRNKVIQFLASREGEGTSTIVSQFSSACVRRLGKSVLIVDADWVDPTQHLFFDIKPESSLEQVIRAGGPIDEAFCQVGNSGLVLTLISQDSAAVSRIFNSPKIEQLWDRLRKQFDLILIDSPPVNSSADVLAICRKVDGVVLVVEAEKTRLPVVENVKERIMKQGGNLLGIVLNKRRYYIPEVVYRRL